MDGTPLFLSLIAVTLGAVGVVATRWQQVKVSDDRSQRGRAMWTRWLLISAAVFGVGALVFMWFIIGAMTMEPVDAV